MVKGSNFLWLVFLVVWPAGLIAGEDRGRPTCDYCRMIITEKEYGGKIKTIKGKTFIFDATECLAAFVIKTMVKPGEIQSLWSMHFNQPGRMLNARTAFYLQSNSMTSPMSINLSAYSSQFEVERMRENHPGEILNWTQVLDHVKQKWFREMLPGPRR
jgi:copper chaperone NosL